MRELIPEETLPCCCSLLNKYLLEDRKKGLFCGKRRRLCSSNLMGTDNRKQKVKCSRITFTQNIIPKMDSHQKAQGCQKAQTTQ